uniref:CWF19-like protein 2 n=1 Tax=Pygocentrus nattereri TaxID=42514 RepID=A0AAR2JQ88_PYGNA
SIRDHLSLSLSLSLQAKKKYEDEERRAAERKARGEDTWMLPEIDQRLQQIGQVRGVAIVTSEGVWGPSKRDEWMTFDFLAMKTTSVAERRARKEAEKEAERERERSVEQAGLHRLELNPYWKDGGSGLPPEESSSTALKKAAMVEDGGLSWLRKSYQRMKEQAEKEQRRLDDIVAERYGSMEQFQKRLQEAEEAAREKWRRGEGNEQRERWRKGEGDEQREKWRRGEGNEQRERWRKGEGDEQREKWRKGEGDEQREKWRKGEGDEQREKWRRGEGDEQRERWRTDSNRAGHREGKRERERDRMRDREERRSRELSLSSLRGRFLKPSDSDDPPTPVATWRKPGVTAAGASNQSAARFLKPRDEEDDDAPAWRKSSGGRELQEARERAREETEQQEKIQQQRSATLVEKSSSETDEDDGEDEEEGPLLTDEEMNKLGAKLVKAELMGNTALMDSLRAQLDAARKARENRPQKPPADADKDLVLFRMDHSGRAWPVSGPSQHVEPKGGRRKRKAIETHISGERVRYFEDDDGVDLREMVRREKMSSAADQNALYSRMAAKMMGKQDGDNYTLDDMFVSSAAQKERAGLDEERQRSRAMEETRRLASRMEKCPHCFTNPELPKHLIIAIGAKVYLSLPNSVSLTEGHCLIAPLQHHCSSTGLDEDVWNEIQVFRRALVRVFEAQDLDCVFLETHMSPKRRLHLLYECVPLPRELGDTAPIYFKKALMECDEEWAMNKKVVDLSSKNIRQAVPRGLPYFSVDFGLQGGFAHVIENEQKFPHYFGKEVLGGMLDLEPRRWRKPIRENFDDQRKKVLQFSQWWKPFDCTKTDS